MASFSGLIPVGRAFLERLASRFWSKAVACLLLVIVADHLFLGPQVLSAGSTVGFFGLLLLMIVWALRVTRPHPVDHILGAAALGLCLTLFNSPGAFATGLLWAALALLVLRPTFDRIPDARDIAVKLSVFTLAAPVRPFKDLGLLQRAGRRHRQPAFRLRPLILPIAATLVFGALFIWANPVLESLAQRFDGGGFLAALTLERLFLWALIAVIVWNLLRSTAVHLPKAAAYPAGKWDGRIARLFSPASVLAALILCNAVFALQNGLDIFYLWAGETLPMGMTHAQYAHRGAYPLILTALLAGAFVLVALRPGSASEHDRPIRAFVYLWLGQNVFLVASAILRTLNYIEDYSLTLLRLSALIWMGLVAAGIVLIVWRIAGGKSGRWLINANALTAAVVLYIAAFLDLSAMIANYNVHHAHETAGRGVHLDISYLNELGPASLPALDWYIGQPGHQPYAVQVRDGLYQDLAARQTDWRTWTWAGDRLLGSLAPPPHLPEPRLWKAP